LPARLRLSSAQVKKLSGEINTLWQASRRRLALEKFLLELYLMLQPVRSTTATAMPDWLAEACTTVQKHSYFSEGAAGLVRASRRSPEHVARVVRAHFKCTPSEYVNRIRMDYAARELRLSTRSIIEIGLECGIQDLSHFYALFREAYGQTPRRYRLAHQMQTTEVFK
jgi:AraC family cel operon transcriptional repressor